MANQKINVLFVSHSSGIAGAELSFLFLLQHLNRDLFSPLVVLPDARGPLAEKIQALNIDCVYLDAAWWINAADQADLTRSLLKEIEIAQSYLEIIRARNIQVVYTNTVVRMAGAIAARMAGIPHLWHIRELLKDHSLQSLFGPQATLAVVAALSDRIVANSRAVAAQFDTLTRPEQLDVVYNAVDVESFAGVVPDGALRRELQLEADSFLIGIIGTVQKHKDHETLLRALALLPEERKSAKVLVIGAEITGYADQLRQLALSLGIGESVKFLPFRQDMPEVFAELDLVVVASLAEPFGRTTIEAMAAGKPVVATDSGASPEIVLDGVTGYLVPPRDPGQMAQAIDRVLCDLARGKELGAAGRERVTGFFSAAGYLSGIEEALRRTAACREEAASRPAGLRELVAVTVQNTADAQCAGILEALLGQRRMADQAAETGRQLAERDRELAERDRIIAGLTGSLSWRLTAPLRLLGRLVGWGRQA